MFCNAKVPFVFSVDNVVYHDSKTICEVHEKTVSVD